MPIQWSGSLTSPQQLAGVIQGEAGSDPAAQFAVASTMYNRMQGFSGFNGIGGGSGDVTQVVTPSQFNGFNANPNSTAQGFANDLWGGGAPQGGDTGNATFFAAPVQGNAAWAAPGGPLFDPGTGGADIGGNYFSNQMGAPSAGFSEPSYGGDAAHPLPGLTAADYGGGSTDFSYGNIGPVSSSDLSPGFAGPNAASFNSQYGFPSSPGLSDSGLFATGGSGQYTTPSYANIPGAYGAPDTSVASNGAGQYSGGGFTETSPGSGFARVTPDASSSDAGSSGGAPITPGPGMPVADQGLTKGVNQAGTDISQAISNPLSGSIKTAGSDVTQAGQTVSTGVNQAANTVSSTGVGILAGIEKYVGEFFLYGAVLVVGVVFLAIGLSKFGGPKIQVARA